MKIELFRGDTIRVFIEGENDPTHIQFIRSGGVVSEVTVGAVSDPETLWKEVEFARKLTRYPRLIWAILKEIAGDYAGMPGDGSPDKRRALFVDGFCAALAGQKPEESKPQSWLKGFSDGLMIAKQTTEMMADRAESWSQAK